MKRKISLTALLFNILMAVFIGNVVGAALGVSVPVVATSLMAIGILPQLFFGKNSLSPSGLFMAGVYREIWTGEIVESLRKETEAAWLGTMPDYSRYVRASANGENEVIHLVDIGADPEVLINNTSYPIGYTAFTDGDLPFSLDKFQTKATKVTDDELYAISYDKIKVVNEKHKNAILATKQGKALHAIAPMENKQLTPLVETSGVAQGGVHLACVDDIIDLQKAMSDAGVPDDGNRVLVLNSQHVSGILKEVKDFYRDYANIGTGQLKALFYGFRVFVYHNNPFYKKPNDSGQNKYEKASFGTVFNSSVHAIASIAFYAPDMFRANGSTKMYFDEPDTQNQQSAINYRHYYLAAPKKERAIAALVTKDSNGGGQQSPAPVINSIYPNTDVKEDDVLVISGTGLANAEDVKFGAVSAKSINVISDNAVTAVVPTGLTADSDIDVTVEAPEGTSAPVAIHTDV